MAPRPKPPPPNLRSHSSLAAVLRSADRLKNIKKEQFEIVITRFNESLEWTNGLEHLCTVYNKGEPFESFGGTVLTVPNYGVGCETILRHIIERYDSLAETTLFCQATLCDRADQPMYELYDYYIHGGPGKIVCVTDSAYDLPTARYKWRISNDDCTSMNDRDLGKFRGEVVKIPYKSHYESWVRGDWISVGRDLVRQKPKNYYESLYAACHFTRGILVEECWFLERSFYSIFTVPLR